MLDIIAQAQKSGQSVTRREISFQTPGPAGMSLSVTAIPLTQAGRPTPVLVLLQDLSSTRKLEKHMEQSDRLASIGTLSASMAPKSRMPLCRCGRLSG